MPVAASVLWRPAAELARPETDPYPIFIGQSVIAAIEDHLGSAREQGLLGFLVGRALQCPHTGLPFLVVDNGVRMPQVIVGDACASVVAHALVAVRRLLRPSGRELVGWYHSHPRGAPTLAAGDRAVHTRYFQRPWDVALVLAMGDKTEAGFFRPPSDATAPVPYLPFYELLDERGDPSGRRRSTMSWSNYQSPDPVEGPATHIGLVPRPADLTARRPTPPRGTRHSPTLAYIPPDAFDTDDDDDDDPATGRAPPRQRRRWLRVLGVSLLVGPAAFGVWFVLSSALAIIPPDDPAPARAPAPAAIPTAVSPEPVGQAIAAYRGRATLFANRQMTCDDLGRGLADVDAKWVQYSVARWRGAVAADTTQQRTDQGLANDVTAVEHDFERTGCRRP
ncbi:MAG TPA: hypothetical protein VH116_09580 [Gemmatimonadales bacterium]|jgi:hypothetical protein|nr:hypothetical protein [Gemmatimonadales bacterium]